MVEFLKNLFQKKDILKEREDIISRTRTAIAKDKESDRKVLLANLYYKLAR